MVPRNLLISYNIVTIVLIEYSTENMKKYHYLEINYNLYLKLVSL
jgi:hypothetical protein